MADAVIGGMLLMYMIAGIYIGIMLPVRRRFLAMLLCALIWPIMLTDVKWKN